MAQVSVRADNAIDTLIDSEIEEELLSMPDSELDALDVGLPGSVCMDPAADAGAAAAEDAPDVAEVRNLLDSGIDLDEEDLDDDDSALSARTE